MPEQKKPDRIAQMAMSNPGVRLLAQCDRGRVLTDLALEYPLVVEAVKRTGIKGQLKLVVTIEPDSKGSVESVEIGVKLERTVPKKPYKKTTFFIEGDGMLTRNDPQQRDVLEDGGPGVGLE